MALIVERGVQRLTYGREKANDISTREDECQMPALSEFLSQRAVFTTGQLEAFLSERGSGNRNTQKALLAYYRKRGRIRPLRRGLYAVVPPGSSTESVTVDPYLVAASVSEDAVLGYHTALEFHGRAYSVFRRLYVVTAVKFAPFRFGAYEFRRAPAPRPLLAKGKQMFGVVRRERSGVEIRVTNLERTLVDVLARPELGGGWEEAWRSLESVEFFDLEAVVEYVWLLGNATTAAKVGFFLDQHREALMVPEEILERLRALRPKQPHYMERRRRRNCRWVKEWNLMAPEEILNRSWGEVL